MLRSRPLPIAAYVVALLFALAAVTICLWLAATLRGVGAVLAIEGCVVSAVLLVAVAWLAGRRVAAAVETRDDG